LLIGDSLLIGDLGSLIERGNQLVRVVNQRIGESTINNYSTIKDP